MDCAGVVTAAVAAFARDHLSGHTGEVCVGLSGGADSLALTIGAVRAGLSVRALVVDHRLQEQSAQVARRAAELAIEFGATAHVLGVTVDGPGGLENAARSARYAALSEASQGSPVLLAHTLDDQAETVLLGLARGSGPRSVAGMRPWRSPWGRPLLGVRADQTRQACVEWGAEFHDDPHNTDPRFTRVRLRREVMPLLDDVLHGGVAPALARTASSIQDDNDALDEIATTVAADALHGGTVDVDALRGHPAAIRRRVLRTWLRQVGATEPTHPVIVGVDALVARWRGQGPVAIAGDPAHRIVIRRTGSVLEVVSVPRR